MRLYRQDSGRIRHRVVHDFDEEMNECIVWRGYKQVRSLLSRLGPVRFRVIITDSSRRATATSGIQSSGCIRTKYKSRFRLLNVAMQYDMKREKSPEGTMQSFRVNFVLLLLLRLGLGLLRGRLRSGLLVLLLVNLMISL